jgi:CRP/FNR family cyclic AMP-dependent transcriptional regulator
MSVSVLDMIPSDSPVIPFSGGKVVFPQGAPGDKMFVVLDGQVDITLNGKVVESVRRGGIIGEMALIDSRPRSAAAIARVHSLLIPIDEQRFNTLVKHRPEFALHIMRILVDRLRRMDAGLASLF